MSCGWPKTSPRTFCSLDDEDLRRTKTAGTVVELDAKFFVNASSSDGTGAASARACPAQVSVDNVHTYFCFKGVLLVTRERRGGFHRTPYARSPRQRIFCANGSIQALLALFQGRSGQSSSKSTEIDHSTSQGAFATASSPDRSLSHVRLRCRGGDVSGWSPEARISSSIKNYEAPR